MPKSKAPPQPQRRVELAASIARTGKYLYEVSGQSRIGPRLMSEYIRGISTPSDEVKQRIAKALDSSVDELFPNG